MGVLRRKSPLFRRRSCRNVAAIEAEVDYIVQRSPFLAAAEERQGLSSSSSSASASLALQVPTFHRKEFQVGAVLGTGSFSQVHSLVGFKLIASKKRKEQQQQHQPQDHTPTPSWSSTDLSASQQQLSCTIDVEDRRQAFAQSAYDHNGEACYAVKFVKKDLSKTPHEFRGAAADLFVEAKYLAALSHPNILKLRGVATGGSAAFVDGYDCFFIIVDRLSETLADRIQRWQQQLPGMDATMKRDLLTMKVDYALQIADALAYLHDRRILFRDLKPSNVGFQAHDPHTIQLFDFGLSRELPVDATNEGHYEDDYAFKMSGAGTFQYMAVECLNTKRYNLKADTFSFAICVFEMITLKRPFEHYTIAEHKEFVCEIGQRPSLTDHDIPSALQSLLRKAWEQDPTERLTMRQVCGQLQPIVQDLRQEQLDHHLSEDALSAETPPPYEGWSGTTATPAPLEHRELDLNAQLLVSH
jgi:serine/threonine protein kinase